MTKVLIVNRLYRCRTWKVFVVNRLYRRVMPKIIVVALVWGLMQSAWGGARAEENSAPAVQSGSSQAQVTHDETSGPAQEGENNLTPGADGTPAPAKPLTAAQPAAAQPVAAQSTAVTDEVVFREDEWVTYLNLPADQAAALKRALAVKHRHKSELADLPGVWLVWVDADNDQPPIIHVDVNEETPEIDRLAPSEIEGVPVEVVKADRWFLISPPYSTPVNSREGVAQPPPNGIQAGGQGGASNARIDLAAPLSAWSKIGPVESARNCERTKAFLIWLATDPRFVTHYTQVIQQQRGANWSYDESKMVEMYRNGVCVAGSDPRAGG